MRLERRGGPPDLQVAFKNLVIRKLRGRALDDNQNEESAQGQFPDFACFRDTLLIEMKHLESEQNTKINNLINEKIKPEEKQFFYGSREAHFVIDSTSNGGQINAAISSKLGRTIETILKKANRQFESYRSRHPRKNSVSLCVILNSILSEYSLDVVARAIHGKLKSDDPDKARFLEIDCILYISEKHFSVLPNGDVAHGVLIYECIRALANPWKMQFIDKVVEHWSLVRSGKATVFEGIRADGFRVVSDISKTMKRYEHWQLEYQRDPYLKTLSIERLREMWHRTLAVSSIYSLKGDWPKPSATEFQESMRIFQHLIEETNRRGIDLRDLDRKLLSPEQIARVYVGLPPRLVTLLRAQVTIPTRPKNELLNRLLGSRDGTMDATISLP